jgi:hypothetical protein
MWVTYSPSYLPPRCNNSCPLPKASSDLKLNLQTQSESLDLNWITTIDISSKMAYTYSKHNKTQKTRSSRKLSGKSLPSKTCSLYTKIAISSILARISNPQSLNINVWSGCSKSLRENFNTTEHCSNNNLEESVCEVDDGVFYNCFCEYKPGAHPIFVIPSCEWVLAFELTTDVVTTTTEFHELSTTTELTTEITTENSGTTESPETSENPETTENPVTTNPFTTYPATTTKPQYYPDCNVPKPQNGVILCYEECYVMCDDGYVPKQLLEKQLPSFEVKVDCDSQIEGELHNDCVPVSDVCNLDQTLINEYSTLKTFFFNIKTDFSFSTILTRFTNPTI